MKLKPMLAATVEDPSALKFPLFASPKLDGVRALVLPSGKLVSRSLKPIPNPFVNQLFGMKELAGLDGELILGDPTAKDVYRQTVGAVSREYGEPAVTYHVFDLWGSKGTFRERFEALRSMVLPMSVRIVPHVIMMRHADLEAHEERTLDEGYEGLILRAFDAPYKMGRSTVREGGMLKLKRFVDAEAEILEIEEELHNANEAKRNALGRTERSTAQAGMVPTGRAGALRVRDCTSGVEFAIGTGLTAEDREFFWKNRKRLVGQLVKYKSFPVGVKDKPRFPVYLGPREKWDL